MMRNSDCTYIMGWKSFWILLSIHMYIHTWFHEIVTKAGPIKSSRNIQWNPTFIRIQMRIKKDFSHIAMHCFPKVFRDL